MGLNELRVDKFANRKGWAVRGSEGRNSISGPPSA